LCLRDKRERDDDDIRRRKTRKIIISIGKEDPERNGGAEHGPTS
jgi:hypothetical protein